MAPDPLQLPPEFPCWVKAIYSWSGESKRDLGFVEGDLIECLNAGDGSWWMGRLRRDRRMMGLFPSNFVELIPNPQISRDVTPLRRIADDQSGSRSGSRDVLSDKSSRTATPVQTSVPQQQQTFRKPFQAYSKLAPPSGKPATPPNGISPQPSKASRKPFQSYSRTPSPNTMAFAQQTASQPSIKDVPDLPPTAHRRSFQDSRITSSQALPRQLSFVQSNYAPSRTSSHTSRECRQNSPPPPPPPPHRTALKSRPVSRRPSEGSQVTRSYQSPLQASPARSVSPLPRTPSPLRDAMNDVMTSLDGMEQPQSATPPQLPLPVTPFSPEEIDRAFERSTRSDTARPRSSMGFADMSHQDYFNHRMPSAGPHEASTHYAQQVSPQQNGLAHPDHHSGPVPPAHQTVSQYNAPRSDQHLDRDPAISRYGTQSTSQSSDAGRKLRNRRSAYELGRHIVNRTFTTKSSATSSSSGVHSECTNASASTQATSKSLMSGHSAGVFSATSAGSLARKRMMEEARRGNGGSANPEYGDARLRRPSLGSREISYISSQSSEASSGQHTRQSMYPVLAEHGQVKKKRSGFFSKIKDAARTGAASVRQNMDSSPTKSRPATPKTGFGNDFQGISSLPLSSSKAQEKQVDWIQVRRDINRSNTLSKNERHDRQDRARLNEIPVIYPVEDFFDVFEGNEDSQGRPVQQATNLSSASANLALVDKAVRFINDFPSMLGPGNLAASYLCRPYRSDVQKARAIFTWLAEKMAWEEPQEGGPMDLRRALHDRRGSSHEIACMAAEMCGAVGLHCEVVEGQLKSPASQTVFEDGGGRASFWNALLVDGEWRMMDCSLASASNPSRPLFSAVTGQTADGFYFACLPSELCYTHVPAYDVQQHICPIIRRETLLALPPVCPSYFRNGLRMLEYDTSATFSEELEVVQLEICVPNDTECIAEVETKGYTQDSDGDYYENGEVKTKLALAQAEWSSGQKRYKIKGVLPGDEGHGILKIYAGKAGLRHSVKDNVHALALALPINHTGKNPPYEFVLRHPTPHALRQDLYVIQPQCFSLASNNTYVFAVRQHPSVSTSAVADIRAASPSPFVRPSSAMSLPSSSNQGSSYSDGSSQAMSRVEKPAKLAIQSPSGKILRLQRKHEMIPGNQADGSVWEIVIKIGERGVWRGLVLADRSARWCVFAEWECS